MPVVDRGRTAVGRCSTVVRDPELTGAREESRIRAGRSQREMFAATVVRRAGPDSGETEGQMGLAFPGCLFARLALADPVWEVIANCPAVKGVVVSGGGPVPVRDDVPDGF